MTNDESRPCFAHWHGGMHPTSAGKPVLASHVDGIEGVHI